MDLIKSLRIFSKHSYFVIIKIDKTASAITFDYFTYTFESCFQIQIFICYLNYFAQKKEKSMCGDINILEYNQICYIADNRKEFAKNYFERFIA